jgi:hypothetical protein
MVNKIMNKFQKISAIGLLTIFALSLYVSVVIGAEGPNTTTATQGQGGSTHGNGAGGPVNSMKVNGSKYQQQVKSNETNQWQFQEQTQFQLRMNGSANVDMECDAENVGNRNFSLDLNTGDNVGLKIKMNASASAYGLEDGKEVKVQNQSQNRYTFRNRFMVQLELNSTNVDAELAINATGNENCTWAYYNETSKEFIPVQSMVQNGMLVAQSNHFSTWTVLTISTTTTEPTIDGYSFIGIISLIGIVAAILIRRKTH